jgi:hypothetical protein
MRDGELTHVTRSWSTHSGQNGRVTDVHTRGGHFTGGLYDVQGRAVFPLIVVCRHARTQPRPLRPSKAMQAETACVKRCVSASRENR